MRCDVLAWHLTSWLRLKPKTNENMPAAGHLLGLQLPRSAPVAATGIEAGTGPKGKRDHADLTTRPAGLDQRRTAGIRVRSMPPYARRTLHHPIPCQVLPALRQGEPSRSKGPRVCRAGRMERQAVRGRNRSRSPGLHGVRPGIHSLLMAASMQKLLIGQKPGYRRRSPRQHPLMRSRTTPWF